MEVVCIKKVMAQNLLIYIGLHWVRRSSSTVTTLATLLLTSQQMFSRKIGIQKNPPNFSKFLFNRKKFVCLFVSTFSGFGNFFQSFENLSRKSILSNKTISYLHDLQQICTSSPKALKISSNHGVVLVLFIMTTPWFDKNVICIAF